MMTPEMDKMLTSILNNEVPDLWKSKSYPSLKPLISWFDDLQARLSMFTTWVAEGQPETFWIPGFFFTQSFLTGVKQGYSRRKGCSIDKVDLEFEVLKEMNEKATNSDEIAIYGLFMEGGAWNIGLNQIQEAKPKQLFYEMPTILFKPILIAENANPQPNKQQTYLCPVYKTSQRAGTLSTTGHSTNYVSQFSSDSLDSSN